MEFYANLHSHSTHSDGKHTPAEMVKVAKAEGYKAIAITDHDTATAYSELKANCDAGGMECIFGVEFSTPAHPVLGVDFHLVGFNFDPEYPEMKQYLEDMSIRETHTTMQIFEEGVAKGTLTGITWDEVLEYNKGITWLCQEHVFRALMDKGAAAIEEFPAWSKANYYRHWERFEPIRPFKRLEEIIDLIHRAGGIAIIAHPVGERIHMLSDLLKMGVDGFEVWHSDMTEEEIKIAFDFCKEHKLYMSGGSDHRGLCGGLYASYEREEDCPYYIKPLSCGVPKEYFDEIKNMKINR